MSESRTLVVMRHAKSSWKTSEPDIRRPLSSRGTRDAVVAGQAMSKLAPDVVLCSPAVRVRQTWQCLQMGGVSSPEVRVLDHLYGAWTDAVLAELHGLPASARTALLINHEPTVSDLVLRLAAASALTAEVEAKFPTAGIAVLRFSGPWSALTDGVARLVTFRVPRG